jgi:hypothetical protein
MVGKLVEMSVESLVVMKGTRMVDLMAASLVVTMVDPSVKPTAVWSAEQLVGRLVDQWVHQMVE